MLMTVTEDTSVLWICQHLGQIIRGIYRSYVDQPQDRTQLLFASCYKVNSKVIALISRGF